MPEPESKIIRRSTIAGTWYPGTEKILARTVDDHISRVVSAPVTGQLLALISPHAGYAYSGQTAAHAYRQLESRKVDTVVIVAPSHRAWMGDYAVSEEDAYETPLGLVPLDDEFIANLDEHLALRRVRGDAEHSLEIQLPFLQRQLGDFRLVPMLTSADDPSVAEHLADALAQVVRQRSAAGVQVLLVASSDLHHIDNYDEVVRRDQAVVDSIAAYDMETLTRLLVSPGSSVCGRMPILAVLHAAKMLGASEVTILHHTNSGDVTGQRLPGQYTVGYMAAAVTRSG